MFWNCHDRGEVAESLELDAEGVCQVREVGVLRGTVSDGGDDFVVECLLNGGIEGQHCECVKECSGTEEIKSVILSWRDP
jgi:hypothetical protein